MDPGAAQLTEPAGGRADHLVAAFAAAADPDRAAAMARYMQAQFPFFGIPAPARRAIQRAVFGDWRPTESELVIFGDQAWSHPEREVQYAACDLVRPTARRCSPGLLDAVGRWIITRSWWDTVDALAHSVGELVRAHPQLASVLDEWIEADNFWLARAAIIHQLGFREATDSERLFRYCERRGRDPEFFIRKAIGWALREHSKTDPTAVVAFVTAHEAELSPLSRREALRRIPTL